MTNHKQCTDLHWLKNAQDLVAQLPNLATLKQVADTLGVHKNTIRNWIALGQLKAVRAGSRVVRIPRDAVLEMLRSYQER